MAHDGGDLRYTEALKKTLEIEAEVGSSGGYHVLGCEEEKRREKGGQRDKGDDGQSAAMMATEVKRRGEKKQKREG
ncbi:hypothetical protein LOK49_LG13G00610 [Camellia lanceoleosa]|uniref:Uncharacterized protein n=1 Tax=Camellia lanceoleosa TaxID=1840588 RepID=A0ACC0FNG1_9ERIC|nr:hypothetical protein LOK49_LG13G00610 [Camellia lanceoleosa]